MIRTTKLALLRARLRRHCSQSRKAFKGNVGHLIYCKSTTNSLIDAARESSLHTVCAINERLHVQQPKVYRYKSINYVAYKNMTHFSYAKVNDLYRMVVGFLTTYAITTNVSSNPAQTRCTRYNIM